MNKLIINKSIFEDIKHVDENGDEYWKARELQEILEYTQWRRFEEVINKAKKACENSLFDVLDHFANVGKMVQLGSRAERKLKDYKLSRYLESLNSIKNLNYLNTSMTKNMYSMFAGNEINENIDLSHFDTSNVTDMSSMFSGYSSSAPLDLSHLDTSNVTNMSYMFSNYNSSAPLDLSHLDTSSVTDMSWMFADYSSSASLDLSHLDTSKVTDMSYIFYAWNSTADLDISNMNLTTLPQYMFDWKQKANKIYVANDTVKNLLKNSGWPYMTDENIIVKGSDTGPSIEEVD